MMCTLRTVTIANAQNRGKKSGLKINAGYWILDTSARIEEKSSFEKSVHSMLQLRFVKIQFIFPHRTCTPGMQNGCIH